MKKLNNFTATANNTAAKFATKIKTRSAIKATASFTAKSAAKLLLAVLAIIVSSSIKSPINVFAQTLTAEQIKFVEKYADYAIKYGATYGMPWETAMAQAIVESAAGTSRAAVEDHNFHGIKSTLPDRAYKRFSNDEAGWKGYYANLVVTKGYRVYDLTLSDPQSFLKEIACSGYNPNPEQYISDISGYLEAVCEYRKEHGWPTSEQYSQMMDGLEDVDGGVSPRVDYAAYVKYVENGYDLTPPSEAKKAKAAMEFAAASTLNAAPTAPTPVAPAIPATTMASVTVTAPTAKPELLAESTTPAKSSILLSAGAGKVN